MSKPSQANTTAGLTVEEVERLYRCYGADVLRRCRWMLRDETAAWDAMHQTFLRVLRYRGGCQQQDRPRAWLYAIATRVCLDSAKARAKQPSLSIPETTASAEPCAEVRTTVAGLLGRFKPSIRQVVLLRYFDGLEVREIANRTGLSERTISRRLQRFMERARLLAGHPRLACS